MADFLNGLQQNFPLDDNPMGKLLNTGVDKDRNNFLKGLKTTASGQKEDPTYLGFRLLFDFNPSHSVDQETFLPISPILCDGPKIDFPHVSAGIDYFSLAKQIRVDLYDPAHAYNKVPNVTQDLYFYTAQGYLTQRRSQAEAGLRPGGGTADNTTSNRNDALSGFKNLLKGINEKSPWFIQSIDGLDALLKIPTPRSYIGNTTKDRITRGGVLTFNCLDSIDLRTTALADLYRKATYDSVNLRSVLPQNLRKFRMWIIVTELRNMHLDNTILDVLNPFNNSAVSNIASTISNIGQASGILNAPGGPPNASVPLKQKDDVYSNLSKLEPYIFMYQLDLCEFDFDDYTHIPSNLSNAWAKEPVSNKFRIHVGKITEKKLQFNILSDLLQNKSQFAPIVIADSWNLADSVLGGNYDINNDGNLFAQLANNFINNSVSSVIQQFSPVVSQAVLGNAYGFQMSDITNLANSVQDLANGINNLKSPFADSRPQSRGLGGPGQRVYPSIHEDVYGNVNPSYFPAGIGNVYPGGTGYAVMTPTDVYPGDPGIDLGLPDRVYPTITEDDYPNDPGTDLGMPDRVYPVPTEDAYPTVAGVDLGLPARVYPTIAEDDYTTVPGIDLGAPDRVYPATSEDAYPTVEGVDLGLPDRVYPTIIEDDYTTVPGIDLGAPDRVYPATSEDAYPTVEGVDLGLPDRVYPGITNDEYPNDPGSDLGPIGRVYSAPNEDVYPHILPNYPIINARVYPSNLPIDPMAKSDVYPTVPGIDLGDPGRQYPGINDNQYK